MFLSNQIVGCVFIGLTWFNVIHSVTSMLESGKRIICIGKERSICSQFYPNLNLLTLDEETDSGDGIVILLTHDYTVLNKVLVIKNHSSGIWIQGESNKTVIDCLPNAGLQLIQVHNVIICDVHFTNCGGTFKSTSLDTTGRVLSIRASVYMSNCTNILILDVTVDKTIGTGMVLFDCNGEVQIINSNFTNNRLLSAGESGGGGLYIELSECSPEWPLNCNASNNQFNRNAMYVIDNCHFVNNTRTWSTDSFYDRIGLGGGGMGIWVRGHATNNTFRIVRSWFSENNGIYGGGLHFQYHEAVVCLSLLIDDTIFQNNRAHRDGGGIDFGSHFVGQPFSTVVSILMTNCLFLKNTGRSGGGTSFFTSLPQNSDPIVNVTFRHNVWEGNTADFAFAINVRSFLTSQVRHFTPTVRIANCTFIENRRRETRSNTGLVAVHSRVIPITLESNNQFISNEGSGIKLVDSSIFITNGSTVSFFNNTAKFGGGIALIGFSSISVERNVSLNFTNNYASFQGGAIYAYSVDEQNVFSLCFIEPFKSHLIDRYSNSAALPKFYFSGNQASDSINNSIHVSSLISCMSSCLPQNDFNLSIFEDCLGDFDFDKHTIENQITTEGSKIAQRMDQPFEVIPGKLTLLPFVVQDEIGNDIVETFLLSVTSNHSITLKYQYTATKYITLLGRAGEKGILNIDSSNFKNLVTSVNVTISECPPGYVNNDKVCVCSAQREEDHYNSILQCDSNSMTAFISNGFWVGYVSTDDREQPGENNLYTAICPRGYCSDSDENNNFLKKFELHAVASKLKLDEAICLTQKRTGILCGECIDNHSIYFHSWDYKCGGNEHCKYGTIYYFLSEILPVTLTFTVIVIAGINFNSGKFNGIILFAQLFQSLSIPANGAIVYDKTEKFFYDLSALIYGPFSLNFFKIHSFSFCIFKGTNYLMIILMEFLTVTYALVLVISLVYLMRCRCCYKLQIACFRIGITKTASLTNGLAAFLVICYSQATRLCYQVLNVGRLRGKGDKSVYPLRVFRMGNIEYFTGIHIPFAICAIVIIVTFVTIPPALLLAYPLIYKIIPERIQNKRPMKIVLNKIEKYRPLFDAFQGCFKDEHRYFAGIHFVYRSAFSTTFAFVNSRLEVYVMNQIIAMMMLAAHLWVQPYKRASHNWIDGLTLLLITIINMLTLWRYFLSYVQINRNEIFVVGIIQLVLLFIPAVLLLFLLIYTGIEHFKRKKRVSTSNQDDDESDMDLDYYRRISNDSD